MTYEEKQVKMLSQRLQHLLRSEYISKFDEVDIRTGEYKLYIKDADKAIEALEKQIPKKPIRCCEIKQKGNIFIARDDDEYLKCPNCQCLIKKRYFFCRMCGQAIDWSE